MVSLLVPLPLPLEEFLGYIVMQKCQECSQISFRDGLNYKSSSVGFHKNQHCLDISHTDATETTKKNVVQVFLQCAQL